MPPKKGKKGKKEAEAAEPPHDPYWEQASSTSDLHARGAREGLSTPVDPAYEWNWIDAGFALAYRNRQAVEKGVWDRPVDALPDAMQWPTWGALRERILISCKEASFGEGPFSPAVSAFNGVLCTLALPCRSRCTTVRQSRTRSGPRSSACPHQSCTRCRSRAARTWSHSC